MKFQGEKEAILIDEDAYPPVASINTIVFYFKALIDSNKVRGIPPSLKIRNIWIPKQYLTYKNDVAAERGVSIVRENKK